MRLCTIHYNVCFNWFDFGTKIGCIKTVLTFHYCFHKYELGETGQAGRTDILNLDLGNGGPASDVGRV